MELLVCYIFYYGGIVGLVLMVGNKIIKTINMAIKGYKTVSGKVVDHINLNDDEYIASEKERLSKENPEFYNVMSRVDEVLTDIGSKYEEKNGIDSDVDNSPSYVSVVEYEVDGKKYRIKNTIGTETKSKKGKRIDVRYNPKNPNDAVIKNDKGFLMLVGLMILFIVFGYFGLHS